MNIGQPESVVYVDDEYVKKWEVYVRKWKRRTLGLAIGLAISIVCVIPFMAGHSLHQYFKEGRYILYLCGSFFSLFVLSSALTYNFWWYLRKLRAEMKAEN